MYVTEPQLIWLNQQGGRTEADVLEDEYCRKFVFMYTPDGNKPVYLPVEEVVSIEH